MGAVFRIVSPGLPGESKIGHYVGPGEIRPFPDYSEGILDFLAIVCLKDDKEAAVLRVDELGLERLEAKLPEDLAHERFREISVLNSVQKGVIQLGFSPKPNIDGRSVVSHLDPLHN